jgi:hypothetical protein
MTKRTSIGHSSSYTEWPHHDDCLLCQIKFARVGQADDDGGFKIERKNRNRQLYPIATVGPKVMTYAYAGLIGNSLWTSTCRVRA